MNELVVDVASFQHPDGGPLPWDALEAAGVRGLVVKLCDGATRVDGNLQGYVNPFAAEDIAGARVRGLGLNAYHFLHASNPVDAQHDRILSLIEGIKVIWIDVEDQGFDGLPISQVAAAAQGLISSFPAHSWPAAGLYADLENLALLSGAPWGYPLWLADPSHPKAPSTPCLLHQFGQQVIGGVTFDVNRFLGTDDQFETLFGTATANPSPPPAAGTPAPVPAPVPPASTPQGGITAPTLTQGSLSGAVRNAQRLLNVHNANLAVDGSYGPITIAAVRSFQKVMGLTVDGVVGPQTWSALDSFG